MQITWIGLMMALVVAGCSLKTGYDVGPETTHYTGEGR